MGIEEGELGLSSLCPLTFVCPLHSAWNLEKVSGDGAYYGSVSEQRSAEAWILAPELPT